MAAGVMAAPGTEYGPCAESCEHRDCGTSRAMAEANCVRCGAPIGYDVRFYRVDGDDLVDTAGQGYSLVHARCDEA